MWATLFTVKCIKLTNMHIICFAIIVWAHSIASPLTQDRLTMVWGGSVYYSSV